MSYNRSGSTIAPPAIAQLSRNYRANYRATIAHFDSLFGDDLMMLIPHESAVACFSNQIPTQELHAQADG
jgi:hypothetical protein